MRIAELPDVVFVDDRGTRKLELAKYGRQIAYLSDLLNARMPSARRFGILFRSTPELVLYWLAALDSGKTPLIMQYPTKKLSIDYWRSTLLSTIDSLKIDGVVCGPEMREALSGLSTLLVHEGGFREADRECVSIEPSSVLQMSSGTTGMRKGIEFAWDDLLKHVAIYNEVMKLTPDDCIVSWLPLYHDMGFIAAFAMPLLLGVPITMMDPIAWVENRDLLFQAIRDHRGTICYMPNFGFEVMSRTCCSPHDLASMRLWISCSEPTYRASIERFCSATSTPRDRIAICYAMAENIFAITQRSGVRVMQSDDQEVVSCGFPLAETELKIVDGQVWVRTPTSIANYVDGKTILDSEGFYPTGDMGFVEQGELYLEGRRHDILVQAGRKFFLNDFDYLLNEVDPSCRGRGASLAVKDERLGTQKLVILVEREDFLDAEEKNALREKLSVALPVEDFELHYVPEKLITKTSSGKVNRLKTAADFKLIRDRRPVSHSARDFERRLNDAFAAADPFRPLGEIVDSLGLVIASILADENGLAFDRAMSLDDLSRAYQARNSREQPDSEFEEVIAIVSCMDREQDRRPGFAFTRRDIDELSANLGLPVSFEHVCLPPVHLVWQDIIFRDFFLPLSPSEKFDSYLRSLNHLDLASVICFDDRVEFELGGCAFPVMDRKLQRAPIADLLGMRFQRYGLQHHQLPIGDVILGNSISREQRNYAFSALRRYLEVPIFRAASSPEFAAETEGWEYRDFWSMDDTERGQKFLRAFERFLRDNLDLLPRRRRPVNAKRFVADDMAHFCSFVVNPKLLEAAVSYFDFFIIQGLPNSLPYLPKRISESGKRFIYLPTLNPDGTLPRYPAEFDQRHTCVLQTGAWRECSTDLPLIRLLHGNGADIRNLPSDLVLLGRLSENISMDQATAPRYIMQPAQLATLKQCGYSDYQLLPDDWTQSVENEKIAASIGDPSAVLPILLETIGTFNVVQYAGRYIGAPQALGPIDLRQHDPVMIPGVIVADSFQEVRRLVSRALIGLSSEQEVVA